MRKDILSTVEGIIELRTGVLRPRVREDYCSFAINTLYKPDHPKMPFFITKMEEITLSERKNRQDYLDYLQRMLGYCTTGESYLEIFCIRLGQVQMASHSWHTGFAKHSRSTI